MKTIELEKNVYLHIHPTKKFKDVSISVDFLRELNRENHLVRLALAMYLGDACNEYKTKQEVTYITDTLYGARLQITQEAKGKASIFEIMTSIVNGQYVKDSSLLEKQFKLMHAFLLNPLKVNGHFDANLFDEIKERMVTMIHVSEDRPQTYANQAAMRLYGGFYGARALPSMEDIQKLTVKDIEEEYESIIQTNMIDIFVLGDVEEEVIQKMCASYLSFTPREGDKELVYVSQAKEKIEKEEERNIGQSNLILLYDTGITTLDPQSPAMMIGNGILGALPTSYLFQEVREKRSLCYTISSMNGVYEGILKISTSLQRKDIEQAKALIQEQLERVKNGDFTEELLNTTKKMYINSWRSSNDSIKSLLWDDYREAIIQDHKTNDDVIRAFEAVTKEDIMKCFSGIEEKVCYVLAQNEVTHD